MEIGSVLWRRCAPCLPLALDVLGQHVAVPRMRFPLERAGIDAGGMIRASTQAARCATLSTEMREASDQQQECFRRMTPAEKLRAAERLYWSARALKRAMLRSLHPHASEQEIDRMVRDVFLQSRS